MTGARQVVGPKDIEHFKDGVILANAGHFPAEIEAAAIASSPAVSTRTLYADDIETLTLSDGRQVHILAEGHMFNLAGPRPMGNSIASMDLGFALQARCLEAMASGQVGKEACVVPVPNRQNWLARRS